jgi:CP family cyanate transporter-like MFS transporter
MLAALNLRIGQVQPAPVLEQVRHDTGMSSTVAGMLGTIPVVCMGLFAFAGAFVIRRVGTNATIGFGLWLIALGTAGRAFMEVPALLLALTVPIGVGVALIGVALPAALKRDFASRAASMTGLYVAALSSGATFAALATVPLADVLGSWRWAFAAGSLVAFAALPFWRPRIVPDTTPPRERVGRRGPDRQGILLAAMFALQSFEFSGIINWSGALYQGAGWSEQQASLAVASVPVLTVVAGLTTPGLTRVETRRWWLVASGVAIATGLVGTALVPTTLPWIWLTIGGLGMGAILPLLMMMPLDLREEPTEVAWLTGWMLGIGYALGALGPTFVGALRDATGSFEAPVLVLAAAGLAAGLLALSPALRPPAPAGPTGGETPRT